MMGSAEQTCSSSTSRVIQSPPMRLILTPSSRARRAAPFAGLHRPVGYGQTGEPGLQKGIGVAGPLGGGGTSTS